MSKGIHVPVAILVFDSVLEMNAVIGRDMFYGGANAMQNADPENFDADQQVKIVSQTGAPVRTFSGSWMMADYSVDQVTSTDIVLVSGVWGNLDSYFVDNQKTIQWLQRQSEAGSNIVSTSTGTLFIAESGLLDGKVATIYWRMVELFKQRYPNVILQPEKSITSAGNIFCSSGVSSGADIATYLIEKLWGATIATRVSNHFLMDVPKGPLEFQLALDQQKNHTDKHIHKAQQWMERNFSTDFKLEEVAEQIGLSTRSLRRRFQSATGDSPLQYLHRIRIETAKELLKGSALGVDQISFRIGYEDAGYFSRLFKKKTQQTPTEYRQNLSTPTSL